MQALFVLLRAVACGPLIACGLALVGCGGGSPDQRLKEAMLAAVPRCNDDVLSIERVDDVEADRAPFQTSITLECAGEAIDAIELDDDDEGETRGLEALRELRRATPLVVRDGRFIANVEGDPAEQTKRDLFEALKKRGFEPVGKVPGPTAATKTKSAREVYEAFSPSCQHSVDLLAPARGFEDAVEEVSKDDFGAATGLRSDCRNAYRAPPKEPLPAEGPKEAEAAPEDSTAASGGKRDCDARWVGGRAFLVTSLQASGVSCAAAFAVVTRFMTTARVPAGWQQHEREVGYELTGTQGKIVFNGRYGSE